MPWFSYDEAKMEVERLVAKFRQFQGADKIKLLGEEETKKDFITPLFRALGWDVETDKSLDEVINEERVSKGRVDYSFRINSIPKFFLEAKALNKGLDEAKDASQAINYAWHKGTSWAVLTDFKTLIIYNAEVKEKLLSDARFRLLTFDQYINNFQDLWLLSRQAFLEGSLDKQALTWGKKLRKTKVGDQLLSELMQYRALLSKNILKNNSSKNLSEEEIDEAVQRIIDRLIFIRTTEDRNIESPTLMPKIREFEEKKKGKLSHSLNDIYLQFDKTYDSRLFTFNPSDLSKRHLCETLEIDNEVLIQIITGLYESKDRVTHYDFSAIDADVLGNIYEQYLSHVLKKTKKLAKVESKEAHRKEQGIYYTPTHIVDYIVRNTLGEALKHKKPEGADKLKVLDMACGSGSFLLKAFDILDSYYKKKEKDYAQTKLDFENETAKIGRKTKILKNNICGVDLDPKAVEIAQLNLLLKAAETKHRLPDLQENIKCGNSLIDDPTVAGEKAFDWNKEFPEIMKDGGFDVIVGNPPYGIVFNAVEKNYLEANLHTFRRNNDLYVAFIEKALVLLKEGGLFSFIIPNTYLIGPYFTDLKKEILKKSKIIKILDLGVNRVFQDPSVFNSIIVLKKDCKGRKESSKLQYFSLPLVNETGLLGLESIAKLTLINQKELKNLAWRPKNKIVEKMKTRSLSLGELCDVKDVGFNYWSVGRGKKRGGSIGSKVLYDGKRESELDIPFLKGRDVVKYGYVFGNHWLRHNYEKYLDKKVDIFRFSPEFLGQAPKVIYRQTADKIIAAFDEKKFHLDKTVHLIIPKKSAAINLLALLAILNSKLILYFYRDLVREEGRTFAQVKTVYVKKIPLRANASLEKDLDSLAKVRIIATRKITELGEKQIDVRTKIEKEIAEIDRKIDELVYDLYDLTTEERRIVEGAVK